MGRLCKGLVEESNQGGKKKLKSGYSLTGLDQARRLTREKWTDGHRVYWSMTEQDFILEMPSVDLKVFATFISKGRRNGYYQIRAQADLDYIAGYWR